MLIFIISNYRLKNTNFIFLCVIPKW